MSSTYSSGPLVFDLEILADIEILTRQMWTCGVDADIVQDVGVAQMWRGGGGIDCKRRRCKEEEDCLVPRWRFTKAHSRQ
eukprot:scaffold32809_cov47-Cyclotella_meneghiniana.AAC.4